MGNIRVRKRKEKRHKRGYTINLIQRAYNGGGERYYVRKVPPHSYLDTHAHTHACMTRNQTGQIHLPSPHGSIPGEKGGGQQQHPAHAPSRTLKRGSRASRNARIANECTGLAMVELNKKPPPSLVRMPARCQTRSGGAFTALYWVGGRISRGCGAGA